ncbi:MAG: hypothetical protein ACLS3W_00195 [Clostridia bacterium]
MVVTIVVLLILAGVTISLLLDENGIIKKSKDARREYGQAKANEQEDLSNLSDMIDEATAEPTPKIDVNTKAGDNSTINGKKGNSNNPTIPKNYIPIDTATSTWGDGSTAPSQDSVNHGLVIKDEQNNEWVWVPVDKGTLATMYEESSDEKTLCGTTGETAVQTKLYSKSEIISGQTRTEPGKTSGFREPDLVVGSGSSNDAKDTYYKTILGFDSKEKMAEAVVAEYKAMIERVSKYGGFYIGRYELSEAGVQKDEQPLTNTNWYNLYKKCTELNASEKVEARMIWGCQWDVTMNWLISSGAKKSNEVNTDSSSWGNYRNTLVKADDGTTEIKASGDVKVLNTGVTTFTMANNIYDLAGNCWEWTQEANNTGSRARRGGSYSNNGSDNPASYRDSGAYPGYGGNSFLRFSSHFNNKVGAFNFNCVKAKNVGL